ncbi:hypothetical protein CPC08DRAFT_738550 [Agrocybe pediades]|nr:hypothetical protein CPC08DRAFT_738550 [Agrocybe pediades]
MHLIYENLISNLILFWTGTFKGLDQGTGSYELLPTVWEAIGKATAQSGSTIPTAYGARPPNIADNKMSCTADTWSFWLLYIGPILLQGRFTQEVYYTHFIELVKLVNMCLQFEIARTDVDVIRKGFASWVEQYERLYYQTSPDRLPACPVTVHNLLHVADGIEAIGPVWAYWVFPVERFCGLLKPAIKSRRHPYTNIDNFILANAQITQIKNFYDLHEELKLTCKNPELLKGTAVDGYEEFMLHYPRIKSPTMDTGLTNHLIAALSTRYSKHVNTVRRAFASAHIELWGKIQILGGGDTIRASEVGSSKSEDSRNATYIRYELLVDKNARFSRKKPELVPKTHYGQLQYIVMVKLKPSKGLDIPNGDTILLAVVKSCKIIKSTTLDMHFYKTYGSTDAVDATTLQCLVGRVFDRNHWIIFDRSGNLARPTFQTADSGV